MLHDPVSAMMVRRQTVGTTRDFGPVIRLNPVAMPPPLAATATVTEKRQARAAEIKVDPERPVIKEFRANPANVNGPMIRGGRVRDPLRRMYESGQLTGVQWNAAEALRDDVALAAGCRINQVENARVRTAMSNHNWPSDEQMDALQRVNATLASYNTQHRELLVWTVLENMPLHGFAKREKMRNEKATAMLQAVLNALANRQRSRERRT